MNQNKIYFILITLLIISCSTTKENTTEDVNQYEDLPKGSIVESYDDGSGIERAYIPNNKRIVLEGELKDGKRHGTWTNYYANGIVRDITTYQNGLKEGIAITIDARGDLTSKAYYHQGKLEGEYLNYDGRRITEKRFYNNGLLEGTLTKYYRNGKVMEESPYKNGVRHGLSKWYDQQGNLTIQYEYDNGELVSEENLASEEEPETPEK